MKLRGTLPLIALLAGAALATTACSGIEIRADRVTGSGTLVSETRDVSGFDRIDLTGEGTVIVSKAATESLVIETDDNLLPYIESEVSQGTLTLSTRERIDIDPTDTVTYRVGVTDLTGLELFGAGNFVLEEWESDSFDILLAGAGNVEVDRLTVDHLDVTLSGAGSIRLAGEVDEQTVRLPGAGSYRAGDLRSRDATLSSTGAASSTIWVTDLFDLSISGVGSVDYYGNPQMDQSITGVGSLQSLGAK